MSSGTRMREERGTARVEGLSTDKKIALVLTLYQDKTNTIDDICQTLRLSRTTFYHYVSQYRRASL